MLLENWILCHFITLGRLAASTEGLMNVFVSYIEFNSWWTLRMLSKTGLMIIFFILLVVEWPFFVSIFVNWMACMTILWFGSQLDNMYDRGETNGKTTILDVLNISSYFD